MVLLCGVASGELNDLVPFCIVAMASWRIRRCLLASARAYSWPRVQRALDSGVAADQTEADHLAHPLASASFA